MAFLLWNSVLDRYEKCQALGFLSQFDFMPPTLKFHKGTSIKNVPFFVIFWDTYTVVWSVYKFYRQKFCIFFLPAMSIILIGKSFIVWSNFSKYLLHNLMQIWVEINTKLLPIIINSVPTLVPLCPIFSYIPKIGYPTLTNIPTPSPPFSSQFQWEKQMTLAMI